MRPRGSGQKVNDAAGINASSPGTGSSKSGAISRATAENGDQAANVKTYGAIGDGVTNDTAAFNAALKSLANAGGGVCLVPRGTYLISASGITVVHVPAVSSDVHLVGEARGACILKVNGMPMNHLLQCDGDNWSVENLTFEMRDYTPSIGFAAIACSGNNWRVANCAILQSGRWGINAAGGKNWFIERNYIRRTVPRGKATNWGDSCHQERRGLV